MLYVLRSVHKTVRRLRGLPDVPHLIIDLGYGRFATGVGTCGDRTAIAFIPDARGNTQKIGQTREDMTVMEPGTVLITLRDRAAAERMLELAELALDQFDVAPLSVNMVPDE